MDESLDDMMASVMEEWVPSIDDSSSSEAERQQVESISFHLRSLNSFIDDFVAALELFDHVETMTGPHQVKWLCLVGGEAVMTIWNFGDALTALDKEFRQTVALRTTLGKNLLRPAIGDFGATFRDVEDARNSNAHPVGQTRTAHARRINSIAGIGVIVHRSLMGRAMTYSRGGRLLTVDISTNTTAALRRIRNTVFTVFRKAEPQSAT